MAITDRRPEDSAPATYLHQLLKDRPSATVEAIVDRAVKQHGWAVGVARHARLTTSHLEMGRVLNDISAMIPETLDEDSAFSFAVRIKQ